MVVVGAGMAGLCTALAAAPRPVLLLSREYEPLHCASALAQGGVAAAIGLGDCAGQHAADTLRAGGGSNRRAAVRLLTESAPAALAWLMGHGVAFDLGGQGLSLAREGGHGHARVVHAGGDRSGARLIAALALAARNSAHIDWRGGAELLQLGLSDGAVSAVRWSATDGGVEERFCSELVLAGGSLVGGFADSTHPASSDGAALMLAVGAGARVADLEYLQFHPTALAGARQADGRLALVTEALRGAGARLRCRDGRWLMQGQHPAGDLAPRDWVARAVFAEQKAGVELHAQDLPIDWEQGFPAVRALARAAGVDPSRQPLPVRVAAHYQMGGIAVDLGGRSSVPGLSAVGEIACTGVHGGNRLASNSLLEAVVFGRRLGERLRASASASRRSPNRWVGLGASADHQQRARIAGMSNLALGPVRRRAVVCDVRDSIRRDPALAETWQAALLDRLCAAALSRRRSHAAHYWDPAESR